ncbi:hypothetical protein E2C01_069158 [Portunus trituberculatus]|uniref:Uncharacterized protein n=1 Tax=Portunus trituberculatus TaxID=210409 RepID=A0A5B7HXU9_PORTR|nr:hypothetical protein [Portunus trituberculatus]
MSEEERKLAKDNKNITKKGPLHCQFPKGLVELAKSLGQMPLKLQGKHWHTMSYTLTHTPTTNSPLPPLNTTNAEKHYTMALSSIPSEREE